MSLSNDVKDAFSKPHGMQMFSELHPMLVGLTFMVALVGALFAATGLLMR